jgi:hypothetical protein
VAGRLICSVILSGIGGREASDNAVEGPLASWNCRRRLREFSPGSWSSGGNSFLRSCRCWRAWDPSTARLLRIREAVASLRMTEGGIQRLNRPGPDLLPRNDIGGILLMPGPCGNRAPLVPNPSVMRSPLPGLPRKIGPWNPTSRKEPETWGTRQSIA